MATLAPAMMALMSILGGVHPAGQRQVGFDLAVEDGYPAQGQAQLVRGAQIPGWGPLPAFRYPDQAG